MVRLCEPSGYASCKFNSYPDGSADLAIGLEATFRPFLLLRVFGAVVLLRVLAISLPRCVHYHVGWAVRIPLRRPHHA